MATVDLPVNLEKCINSIIEKEDFIAYNIIKQGISTNGEGYMGNVYAVDIKGKTGNGQKEINIFAKNIVKNAESIQILCVKDIYAKETFAYKEISKIFKELQDEFDIPLEERYEMTKSYEESNTEAIILENLTRRGYKTYERMNVVSLKFAELSVEKLAKFHALSLILEKKKPEYFNEKIKTMKQPFIFGQHWQDFMKNMFNISIKYLDEDVRNKVQDIIADKVDKYPVYMNDPTSIGTMCHGDYRHNNIMVKEINGQPSEVIPVDYQLLHYGCPILDLIYFIFNGTDQQFRKKHLTDLKETYYETLRNFLLHFHMDSKDVFPKEEFEKLFKQKLDFGLMINVFYIPFLFAAEDDVPDVTQPLGDMSFKVDPKFGDRFRGVIEDFIKWGYLEK